jgi:hypothetical protein
MAQYYIAIILDEDKKATKEHIRAYLSPERFDSGGKLMEHSYIDNHLMKTMEYLISPEGPFYKSRVVWAGHYARPEYYRGDNLYRMVGDKTKEYTNDMATHGVYNYIVNHTKSEYTDKKCGKSYIHPLSLLTSEGNGAGGGDYTGDDGNLCGIWARDVISMEDTIPRGYSKLVLNFEEY